MRRIDAETIAARALAWLAADEDMLLNFVGATGASPATWRAAAQDPAFMAGVLDFVALDDEWVIRFAQDAGIPPDAILRARAALPGGELPEWT